MVGGERTQLGFTLLDGEGGVVDVAADGGSRVNQCVVESGTVGSDAVIDGDIAVLQGEDVIVVAEHLCLYVGNGIAEIGDAVVR